MQQDQTKYVFEVVEVIYEIPNKDMTICLTCNKHLRNSKYPHKQLGINYICPGFLGFYPVLTNLRVFLARRILFNKVSIMPKGRFP